MPKPPKNSAWLHGAIGGKPDGTRLVSEEAKLNVGGECRCCLAR